MVFQAYLSLPEGTATAAGLIAMMTDHYNILQEGNESDPESNDVAKASQKPQKRGRGKFRLISKGSDGCSLDRSQYQSASSRYGCLSLLKKKRSGGTIFHNCFICYLAISVEQEIDRSKLLSQMDADCHETSLGSREAENGVFARDGNDGSGAIEAPKRVKKRQGKRPRMSDPESFQIDDDREACSGTEEGSIVTAVAERGGIERQQQRREVTSSDSDSGNNSGERLHRAVAATTVERGSVERQRQQQLREVALSDTYWFFFVDENSALDALQTLADLSVNILLPSSVVESG
ncbi:hypothetical protein BHM03_00013625 [Ensete ventricosum]|nr:hypothetical protein BHM03_00013625 [Ensete ventricosum]